MKTLAAAMLLFLALGTPVCTRAHDLWLQPEPPALGPQDTLQVRLLVGNELEVEDELPLSRRLISRFLLVTERGVRNLEAALPPEKQAPRIEPILRQPVDFSGSAVVILENGVIETQFSRQRFQRYLEHEGIQGISLDLEPGKQDYTERYRRTLRCLLYAGTPSPRLPDVGVLGRDQGGAWADLQLMNDPHVASAGDTLRVRFTVDGQPRRLQRVSALSRSSEGEVSIRRTRTGPDGVASFVLDDAGFWLIRLVHLRPCADPDVDWESMWLAWSFWWGAGPEG